MTEQLHFHFSLSCTGEWNGNPLQCSCLENPRDGGAWWAAVYGVAQSRTRLKRLSSSSSRPIIWFLFPHLTCPGTPSWDAQAPLNQDGSQSEGFWEEHASLWPSVIPWHLTPKEDFWTCVVSPLFQKRGEWRSLNPLLKQGFTPLCPYRDYYLKVFTRDKHWLFTLFLLLLPIWRANGRLIINASTGAHQLLSQEM